MGDTTRSSDYACDAPAGEEYSTGAHTTLVRNEDAERVFQYGVQGSDSARSGYYSFSTEPDTVTGQHGKGLVYPDAPDVALSTSTNSHTGVHLSDHPTKSPRKRASGGEQTKELTSPPDFNDQVHEVNMEHALPSAASESRQKCSTSPDSSPPPSTCGEQCKEKSQGHYNVSTFRTPCSPENRNRYSTGTYSNGQFTDKIHSSQCNSYTAPTALQTDPAHSKPLLSPDMGTSVGERPNEEFPNPYDDVASIDPHQREGGPAGLGPVHHPIEPVLVSEQRKGSVDACMPNIVIFGETGVGKSSIINLIAGQKLARTSNSALGCTFHHERYPISLGETPYALWDTAGLDEGSEGTINAKQAESNLKELMQQLARSGGINLVIYCIRNTRLTRALKRNYDLFYVTVCRKKVPVALAVTGLEHQEVGMETWWTTNEPALRRHGMRFDAHACVTTVDAEDRIIQDRRSESQRRLRELVTEYSRRAGWKADPSFISRLLPSIHGIMSSVGNLGSSAVVRKVTVCGSFTKFFPGTTASLERSTGQIRNAQYQIVRVDKIALNVVTSKTLEDAGGVGAGVLVFYTSSLMGNRIPPEDVEALKTFYNVGGGQMYPVIVVLQGCKDEKVAQGCEVEVTSHHNDVQAYFVPFPINTDAQNKLEEMIERLCIEQVDIRPKFLQRYRRFFPGFGDGMF